MWEIISTIPCEYIDAGILVHWLLLTTGRTLHIAQKPERV